MEILIVRHGLAGKPDPSRFPDDDLRPLTPKGEKAFRLAAKGLRALGVRPVRILSSPALRTLATAHLLADRLGLAGRAVVALDVLHHSSSPESALRSLARKRWPARLALVGHEPWLGRFVSLLVAGTTAARLPLRKGGACLIAAERLSPGAGALVWSMTQEQLQGFG